MLRGGDLRRLIVGLEDADNTLVVAWSLRRSNSGQSLRSERVCDPRNTWQPARRCGAYLADRLALGIVGAVTMRTIADLTHSHRGATQPRGCPAGAR
jgi:hypothetical protein